MQEQQALLPAEPSFQSQEHSPDVLLSRMGNTRKRKYMFRWLDVKPADDREHFVLIKKKNKPKTSVLGPDQTTTTVSGQDGPWERCFVVPNLPNAVPHVVVTPIIK